jgi:hypothetical protein
MTIDIETIGPRLGASGPTKERDKEEMEAEKRIFKTDNLNLAAYILAKGIKVISISMAGRFGIFSFEESEARPEADRYMDGQALISPQAYSNSIRELKRLVDEAIENDK